MQGVEGLTETKNEEATEDKAWKWARKYTSKAVNQIVKGIGEELRKATDAILKEVYGNMGIVRGESVKTC